MDYLQHIVAESQRFHEAVRTADSAGPVPSCPDWDVADLVWHLTEVQAFWGDVVARRLQRPDDAITPDRPQDYPALLNMAEETTSRLAGALGVTDAATPVWTWATDNTVGFVLRRQAHEVLIHRVDAELATGRASAVDPELARDGIDEMVEWFVAGSLPEWSTFSPDGTTIRLESTEPPASWGLVLGRFTGTSPASGTSHDLDAAQSGAPTSGNIVRGTAAALDLWLWGRGGVADLEISGDPAVAARLRALAADATQ